jgi:hypothetical protein
VPTTLTPAELAVLPTVTDATTPRHERRAAMQVLAPLLEPLDAAGHTVGLAPIIRRLVRRAVLGEMQARGTAYGVWDGAVWVAASGRAGAYAANVLAVAYHLGGLTGAEALAAGVQPTPFAWHVFGHEPIERESRRLEAYLLGIGYGRSTIVFHRVRALLARLFLLAGRPTLEAVTIDLLESVSPGQTTRTRARSVLSPRACAPLAGAPPARYHSA